MRKGLDFLMLVILVGASSDLKSCLNVLYVLLSCRELKTEITLTVVFLHCMPHF